MKKIILIATTLILINVALAESTTANKPKVQEQASFRQPHKKEELFIFEKKGNDLFSDKIELMVWNIYAGVKKNVITELDSQIKGKDLVLIQETYFNEEQNAYFKKSNFNWYAGNAHVHIKSGIVSGVGTGSLQKAYKHQVLYSKYHEPLMNVKKATLFSWYKLNKRKNDLLVVNVHAINFVPDSIYREQISEIFKVISKHQGPVILAGDFNTFNYSKLKFLNFLAKEQNIQEIKFEKDERKVFMKNALDHIYSRGFKILGSETKNLMKYSDHNPIYATLELEKEN